MSSTSPLVVPIPSIEQLTDNAARLLQQSLADAAETNSAGSLSAVDLALARSNLRALAFVQAVGVHGAYRFLRDYVARQAVPSTATDKQLDDWLTAYSLPRKVASTAQGSVAGAGVTGTVLAAGTLLQTDGGLQLRTTAAATVVAGTITAPVAAVLEGSAGNIGAATPLTLVSPVVGINSGWVATDGLAGGADVETDDQAHTRLAQRLGAVPMGGAPADYARWALQVPGITRAFGVRNPAGGCTAGVIILADANAPYGVPTAAQQAAVVDYIRDPRRGPPDELFVIVPVPVPVDVTLHLAPDTAAIRAGVLSALADLFTREAVPGSSIPHSHLTEAISGVVGEYNHTISVPTIVSGGFFTTADFQHVLVLGTVTFA